ncbi:hypothetical protein FQN57_001486 [Myotisia sp. PD_48]|nr:hypothetical protein FQN57_001486 [Myotisia sp. PD_48]
MASTISLSRRPTLNLFSSCEFLPPISRRNQSTYRRTKKRLRVAPDASFAPSTTPSGAHIIHNPPSSAPSVYITPTIFLPRDDIRRKLRTDPFEQPGDAEKLPSLFPESTPSVGKKLLSEEDIQEMRNLRSGDPMTWSRGKLAARFGCSPLFVSMVCEASKEKKDIQRQILSAVRSRWGASKTLAREDRELRKELWSKDR